MRLLKSEISLLRETVERLTKECAERTAEGPDSESEGQKGGSPLRRGRKEKPPGPNENDYGSATPVFPTPLVSVAPLPLSR